jgi:protein TonB
MNNARISSTDRLGLTLFFALAAHAIVILGVSFSFEAPKKQPPPARTLEIIVVQPQKLQPEKRPDKADFLAQSSQQGGGSHTQKLRPTSRPAPASLEPTPQVVAKPQPKAPPPIPSATSEPHRKVVATTTPAQRKVRIVPARPPIPPKPRKLTATQLLTSTSQEISRLTAEIDRRNQAYAKRQRRKWVTASTQEYKYASYLDAWRKKVERIGNLNYPDKAKRRRLYGNLVLHVAVRADGSVKEINIKKSSGHKLLDDAAIRIVRLSAPFAPFPANIRKETDIMDIVRTWQFRSNNQLFAK